jgi:hypothetical protein
LRGVTLPLISAIKELNLCFYFIGKFHSFSLLVSHYFLSFVSRFFVVLSLYFIVLYNRLSQNITHCFLLFVGCCFEFVFLLGGYPNLYCCIFFSIHFLGLVFQCYIFYMFSLICIFFHYSTQSIEQKFRGFFLSSNGYFIAPILRACLYSTRWLIAWFDYINSNLL